MNGETRKMRLIGAGGLIDEFKPDDFCDDSFSGVNYKMKGKKRTFN